MRINTAIFLYTLISLVVIGAPTESFARPFRACLLSDGSILIKRKCRAGKGQTTLSSQAISGIAATQVGPQGPAGKDGDSVVLCYGKLANTGNLLNFGGKGTTNVTVEHNSLGSYQITCHGSYSGISSYDDLTTLASCENSRDTVGIAAETSNFATELLTYATVRKSSDDSFTDCYLSFMVLGSTN
ncbi:MAG: hypothetical protein KDD66_18320 [Bdellovibrionales bacterium]|nr:hypothetical protein [Bdellovibrionales bacterium]